MSKKSTQPLKIGILTVLFIIAVSISILRFFPSKLPGGSWQKIDALPNLKLTVLKAFSIQSKTWLFAGVNYNKQGSAVFISSDGGRSWMQGGTEFDQCDEITSIDSDSSNAGYILLSAFNKLPNVGGVFLSKDYGKSWTNIGSGLPSNDFRIVKKIGNRIYFGTVTNGIAYSDDYGQHWQECNQGLTNLYIQTVCSALDNPQHLLCGTLEGLFLSTDGGSQWSAPQHKMSKESPFILEIVADLHHKDRFYALDRTGGLRTDVYRSDDGGRQWRICMNGIPEEFHPRAILVDSFIPDRIYLATVYDGIYLSKNAGDSWIPINQGIPLETPMIFHSITQGAKDAPFLFAATNLPNLLFKREGPYGFLSKLVECMSSF